jgi:hypothetical protein
MANERLDAARLFTEEMSGQSGWTGFGLKLLDAWSCL